MCCAHELLSEGEKGTQKKSGWARKRNGMRKKNETGPGRKKEKKKKRS